MKYISITYVLLALIIIEVLCHGYFLMLPDKGAVSVIYFLAGIGIAGVPLIPFRQRRSFSIPDTYFFSLAWLVLLLLLTLHYADDLFDAIPIHYTTADMLPVIQVMCERYLQGESVYVPIPEIWDGMLPIYLPAMWMPFIPAVIGDVDLRLVPLLAIFIGLFVMLKLYRPIEERSDQQMLILIPLTVLIISFLTINTNLLSMTEEGLVVAYYLFLVIALSEGKVFYVSLAIVLCLLSRYVIVFWVPMYLGYLFLFDSRAKALAIVKYSLIMGLVLMLISQGFTGMKTFIGVPDGYLDSVMSNPEKYEQVIQNGLGMAKFFPHGALPQLYNSFLVINIILRFSSIYK